MRTASEGVSFAVRLEGQIGDLYRELTRRWPVHAEAMDVLEKETSRNAMMIQRTYYGSITDAAEGGFCFDLEVGHFDMTQGLPANVSWAEAITETIRFEETALRFYEKAATQSAGLLDDMSRLFRRIATRRGRTLAELRTIVLAREA